MGLLAVAVDAVNGMRAAMACHAPLVAASFITSHHANGPQVMQNMSHPTGITIASTSPYDCQIWPRDVALVLESGVVIQRRFRFFSLRHLQNMLVRGEPAREKGSVVREERGASKEQVRYLLIGHIKIRSNCG